ncbi:MAG: asparaginase [Sedimenticola sp.]
MNDDPNPVLVEVTRGGHIECRHRGAALVISADGTIIGSWGDTQRALFPRSAIKPLQAIPLVESGAAQAFEVSERELALACASHSGEAAHVEAVAAWLQRIGLDVTDLECGDQWPMRDEAARALVAAGEKATALHNNCSGKHTGFLTTALHMGEDTRSYVGKDHAVQQRIAGVLSEMMGVEIIDAPCGIDGCSIPTWAVPLDSMALAMARFASPDTLSPARGEAVRRIFSAMTQHPFMVAGSERYCSEVMAATDGRLMVKTGAEGVFCAALPEQGIGIALKCDDGAKRASETLMTALLFHLDLVTDREKALLEKRLRTQLDNWNGINVGEVRPAGPFSACSAE